MEKKPSILSVLFQFAAEAKSNEITAFPLLLKLLDLNQSIVTIDAAGCQKEVAAQIRTQGGDYLLALKRNQGGLHAEALYFFQQALESLPQKQAVNTIAMKRNLEIELKNARCRLQVN